jgi:allophanate hydrolase subunit 1
MRKEFLIVAMIMSLVAGTAMAAGPKEDPFQGRLFPPNLILENQADLDLSKQQFTDIKAAVVDVQTKVAEHEWDLREAYQALLAELDKAPIDDKKVLELVDAALRAENEVKKQQVAMLIKLKNLLNEEQVAYLESVRNGH